MKSKESTKIPRPKQKPMKINRAWFIAWLIMIFLFGGLCNDLTSTDDAELKQQGFEILDSRYVSDMENQISYLKEENKGLIDIMEMEKQIQKEKEEDDISGLISCLKFINEHKEELQKE